MKKQYTQISEEKHLVIMFHSDTNCKYSFFFNNGGAGTKPIKKNYQPIKGIKHRLILKKKNRLIND